MISAFTIRPAIRKQVNEGADVDAGTISVHVDTLNIDGSQKGLSSALKEVGLSENDIVSATARICGVDVKFWTDVEGMVNAPRVSKNKVFSLTVENSDGIDFPLLGNVLITGLNDEDGNVTSCPVDMATISRHLHGQSLLI